jgi:hypothetical protein
MDEVPLLDGQNQPPLYSRRWPNSDADRLQPATAAVFESTLDPPICGTSVLQIAADIQFVFFAMQGTLDEHR